MTTGTSDCGLKYAVLKSGNAVAYCALGIKCGTRDEEGFHSGIAHFTEHTIFRGTKKRSASVINNYLDRLGGDLNAFTNKEEIVIHSTVLKEDLPKAVGLLMELATSPTFPEDEIETERGVVIDEIISYKDSPSDDVYDRFEEEFFKGHPLGKPILGTTASVKKITSEELRKFVAEKFIPSRMVLTVVSPDEEKKTERLVKRDSRSRMRRVLEYVDYCFEKDTYLDYSLQNRIFNPLTPMEKKQIIDYIVCKYNPVPKDILTSRFGSYENAVIAIDSTTGSEHDIIEAREDYSVYVKMLRISYRRGTDLRSFRFKDRDNEELRPLIQELSSIPRVTPVNICRFLHLKT